MKREEEKRYRTFEDLEAYQIARAFRKSMYGIGRRLPDFEKFSLAGQIRRAAVSLTNNIAEGHGRFHFLDQIKFMLQARGSLEELLDDLNGCEDEKYVALAEIESLKAAGWRVHKLINGYIRFLRTRKAADPSRIQEQPQADEELDDLALLEYEAISRCNPSTLQPFNDSP